MAITTEDTAKIVADYQRAPQDTGSPEVQVALLTARITYLTEHFKSNKKDNHSRRGLIKMVADRRSHLKFLEKTDKTRYATETKKDSCADSHQPSAPNVEHRHN